MLRGMSVKSQAAPHNKHINISEAKCIFTLKGYHLSSDVLPLNRLREKLGFSEHFGFLNHGDGII